MFDFDISIRSKAFNWLVEQTSIHGDVLPRRPLLEKGFIFQGESVPLVSAQGIFKPRIMELPISITTSPESHYDDSFGEDGLIRYLYRISPSSPNESSLQHHQKVIMTTHSVRMDLSDINIEELTQNTVTMLDYG